MTRKHSYFAYESYFDLYVGHSVIGLEEPRPNLTPNKTALFPKKLFIW